MRNMTLYFAFNKHQKNMNGFIVFFLSLVFQFPYKDVSAVITITVPEPLNYYTVALFEHNRKVNLTTQTPSQIVDLNLDYYERATNFAGSKGVDIIIFPEYGLMPLLSRQEMKSYLEEVPDPKKGKSNPCDNEREFANRPMMYRLSCMAKRNNLVIVANTGDIQPCLVVENLNCPDDGTYHFNGNVVFNRDGTILAKYHKEHLFFEPGMDLPQVPQNPIFTTDFGTFAMYVCFDSVWKPIVEDAQRPDVDGVILPTMWVDTMPLWNAVQWWQAWAFGNNITFLVSNANLPWHSAVGSGVFSGRMGALKYTFNPDGLSKLLISRAPKSRQQDFPFPNVDSSITVVTADGLEPYDEDEDGKDVPTYCSDQKYLNKDYKCGYENMMNYTFVKLTKLNDTLEACNNGMCCHLEYSAEDMTETYYFGVYNGSFNVFPYSFCIENCLVARCDDDNGVSCSKFPLRSNTVFHKLKLHSNFSTKFVYPSVLKSGIRLSSSDEWTHGIDGETALNGYLTYESMFSEPLLVAGLNGRCYDRDPPQR